MNLTVADSLNDRWFRGRRSVFEHYFARQEHRPPFHSVLLLLAAERVLLLLSALSPILLSTGSLTGLLPAAWRRWLVAAGVSAGTTLLLGPKAGRAHDRPNQTKEQTFSYSPHLLTRGTESPGLVILERG
jgi:hypothetical protein